MCCAVCNHMWPLTKLLSDKCIAVQIMNRWLGVRIDFISNTVVFATALMVSALLPVNAGMAGLAMTAAVNLTDNLSWFVRMVSKSSCTLRRQISLIKSAGVNPPDIPLCPHDKQLFAPSACEARFVQHITSAHLLSCHAPARMDMHIDMNKEHSRFAEISASPLCLRGCMSGISIVGCDYRS